MHFGRLYAKYYDLLYSDKDYEKECDFIEDIFKTLASHIVRSIADVSCGTGGHAIPLAKRGYKVTAIDLSERMVRIALGDNARTSIAYVPYGSGGIIIFGGWPNISQQFSSNVMSRDMALILLSKIFAATSVPVYKDYRLAAHVSLNDYLDIPQTVNVTSIMFIIYSRSVYNPIYFREVFSVTEVC